MTEKAIRSKRRVQIAEDVLAWLRTKRLNVVTGSYCVFDEGFMPYGYTLGTSLQKILPEIVTSRKPCQVCAKGAMFIAAVDRYNKVQLRDANGDGFSNREIIKAMKAYFSKRTLDLIEVAFECKDANFEFSNGYNQPVTNRVARNAIEFGKRYQDPRARLRAIMRNLISNNGDFVPPPAKEAE